MRKQKEKVELHPIDACKLGKWGPVPLKDVRDFIDELILDYSEEATLDLDYDESYGDITIIAQVRVKRFETKEEAEIREAHEKDLALRTEKQERVQYERLKRKFGD